MSAQVSSILLFLSELAMCPRQMGTIWPSSAALAEAMARWLPAHDDQLILELGPGTGVVTEKLLAAGLPEERLVAVERSHRLACFLRERFPKASIITADAVELDQIFAGMKFGGVFSSLPLKVFTDQQVERISAAMRHVMLPGAHWVQYSYQIFNGRAPTKSFRAVDCEIVWQNLPPAKVSVYRSV
jgi:phosphatidylethanolamine/phosphatidyl-N-methylethanolamine N-methyltransferase